MFKFDKVGERIKNLAKGIFIVETIAGIIYGIVIMFGGAELILIGILVALGAVFVGYLTSLPIYGLGEIITRLVSIDEKINYTVDKSKLDKEELIGFQELKIASSSQEETNRYKMLVDKLKEMYNEDFDDEITNFEGNEENESEKYNKLINKLTELLGEDFDDIDEE